MNDDLTPELEKAMKKLPRERMPAGAEDRMVAAMRERGFLKKRRRTIVVTSSRVAGLVAACVALIIGAYSIGLQRGGGDAVLPSVAPLERDDRGRAEQPATEAPESKAERQAVGESNEETTPSEEIVESVAPEVVETVPPAAEGFVEMDATPQPAKKVSEPKQSAVDDTRQAHDQGQGQDEGLYRDQEQRRKQQLQVQADEAVADRDRNVESATIGQDVSAPPTRESPTPAAKSFVRPQMEKSATSTPLSKRPLTFWLNGKPVIVEAPDSVRVTQDERGRILLIYTSDGVIRIRMAEDD